MVSNFMIGLLMGLGAGGWIYGKVQRRTGGNTQDSLIMAGVGGFFVFLLVLLLLSAFF